MSSCLFQELVVTYAFELESFVHQCTDPETGYGADAHYPI